jgi:transposase InsO family protein
MDDKISSDLRSLYYDPSTGYQSLEKFYRKVRALYPTIKRKQVQAFLRSQEVVQVFRRRKVKYSFPLSATAPLQRIQIDLLDVSNLSHANGGVKFLFNAVDVFTKIAFSRPLRNKGDSEVLNAWKGIVAEIQQITGFPPLTVDSDKESSFRSRQFRKFCSDHEIFQHFKDYNQEVSQVETFNKTLRLYIQRYLTASHTQRYLPVLQELIQNYNSSYHRRLGKTPTQAISNNEFYERTMDRLIARANGQANRGGYGDLKVGDKVRLKLRKGIFDKKSTALWSKTIHVITAVNRDLFSVSDRAGTYKAYELQRVGRVEQFTPQDQEQIRAAEQEVTGQARSRRVQRSINKEGVDSADVVQDPNERALRRYRTPRDVGPFIEH